MKNLFIPSETVVHALWTAKGQSWSKN